MHKKTKNLAYRLKNWAVVRSPWSAPETQGYLRGNIYGHPDYPNGTEITTSAIRSKIDGIITTYSGTSYIIFPDEVDPEYEKKYPNAWVRLFRKVKPI